MLASGQPLPHGEPDTGREAASANRWQQGRMHEVLDADRTPEQGSPSCSGFFWLKDQIMRVCCGNRGKSRHFRTSEFGQEPTFGTGAESCVLRQCRCGSADYASILR